MTPNDTAKKARILDIGILVHDHKKERRGPRAQYMHVYSTLPFMIMNVTDHQKKWQILQNKPRFENYNSILLINL